MPEDKRPTVDNHQRTYDTRLVELKRFMILGNKNNPNGWRWGQILKHFFHVMTEDGSFYSVDEKTLLGYMDRFIKQEDVEYISGRYVWVGDEELEFSAKSL